VSGDLKLDKGLLTPTSYLWKSVLSQVIGLAERLISNPPVKQFRIGEVASYSGLSRQTVHNYTVMGLIRERNWTQGGHRLYGEEVFVILSRIELLKNSQTLREIRLLLDSEGVEA
jgi:hypothetical protein